MTTEKPTECEVCGASASLTKHKFGIWMCAPCTVKENELQAASQAEAEMRVLASKAKPVEVVSLKQEIFNATTISIVESRKRIDADETITNKPFAEASQLTEWFKLSQQVLLEAQKIVTAEQNKQAAYHSRLNELANQLKIEEREKLQLKNINYNPSSPKKNGKVATPKVKAPSAKMTEVRELAEKHNLLPHLISLTVKAMKCSPKEAVQILLNAGAK